MPLIGRREVEKSINKLIVERGNFVKSVWIQGLKAVITGTPVHFQDGGRLRNNWFLTVGSPSGSTRGRNQSGNGSFSSLDKMPESILGKTVYFTNNMPYANVVEYGGYPKNPKYGTWTGTAFQKLSQNGYSKQAPAGMVRINIKKMAAKL